MSLGVELRDIVKSFGAIKANDGVNLKICKGTIHALVGENGAGKSTTMKILFGLHPFDSGSILIDGKPVDEHWNPGHAFEQGIGMVHQHFMLALLESVHDNLVLGVEQTGFLGLRKRKEERTKLEKLMKDTGLTVPLNVPVSALSIGQQSRVEILKVLYRKPMFLILDEPTSVLMPHEVAEFLETLNRLKAQGCTILLVTHKLKEVMDVADDVTVIRAGKIVATKKISGTSIEELSQLMVGRKLFMPQQTKNLQAPKSMLSLEGFSLDLHPGIITGIAGVEGNGQESLIEGLIKTAHDKKIPLALIPSDRHHEGSVLSMTLTENLRLTRRFHDGKVTHYEKTCKKALALFSKATKEETEILKTYDVRPADSQASFASLSGGNQQKLIVGRELSSVTTDHIVLAVHPTRGVDLGAIEFIHAKILEVAAKGAAVLLVSSELEELMALSHRIASLYRKQITQWFEGPRYDEHKIGFAMLGGKTNDRKDGS